MTAADAGDADGRYGREHEALSAHLREWVLIDGHRVAIAALLLGTVYVLLLALSAAGVVGVTDGDAITRLAGGMFAGTFSLVTLVVSINQLILSQELTSAGELRERIGDVMAFEGEVEEVTGVPASPADPSSVLQLLAGAVHRAADRIGDAVAEMDDRPRHRIGQFVTSVKDGSRAFDASLEGAEFGQFRVVSATIDYEDSWQLYAAKQLRNTHADDLPEDAVDGFDDLIEALETFTVARNYVKATYMERELTKFSRQTVYTGLVAVLAAVVLALLYAPAGGPVLGSAVLPYVVAALIVAVLSPLALLASYIVRTATVTRRTAVTGPMLPGEASEEGPFGVVAERRR